jgi:hypothetical protein
MIGRRAGPSGILPCVCLALCGLTTANPSPPSGWSNGGLSLVQTLEADYQIEHLWNEEDSTEVLIIYGGPALVYNYLPEDYRGLGVALEIGVELRKQYTGHPKGIFTGLYAGAGVQWSSDEEGDTRTTAASFGIKIGDRIPLFGGSICIDAEPYLCIAASIPVAETDLAGAAYIGLKIDIF